MGVCKHHTGEDYYYHDLIVNIAVNVSSEYGPYPLDGRKERLVAFTSHDDLRHLRGRDCVA